LYKLFKDIIEIVFAVAYALILPIKHKASKRVVLFYHGIRKKEAGQFERQMAYLGGKCKVVRPSEIRTASVDGPKIIVAIIFDDAFVSVLENAVPILRKHEIPAGIAVPAANIGRSPDWNIPSDSLDVNETVMSQEQIEGLDKEHFEILSHTLTHPVLTQVEDGKLHAEVVDSKHELERISGCEVSGSCYPYGAFDDRVCEAAAKAGYRLGFTTEPVMVEGSESVFLRIGRFAVSPRDSLFKFKLKVCGAYQVCRYLRLIKRSVT